MCMIFLLACIYVHTLAHDSSHTSRLRHRQKRIKILKDHSNNSILKEGYEMRRMRISAVDQSLPRGWEDTDWEPWVSTPETRFEMVKRQNHNHVLANSELEDGHLER